MAMSKKTFMALITISLILASIVFGMQTVEDANANFLPTEKPTNPPPITINSPLNTTYNQNDILLNFTIVGISRWWIPAYHLTNLYYEIDGKSTSLYVDSRSNTEQYATSLIGLSKGEHTLTVHANAEGVYSNNPNPPVPYSIESTQTVSFAVDKELEYTPSPTPSITPTPSTPEFTLSLGTSFSEGNKTIVLAVKNQPFVPYYDASSGWNISLYYNIRMKMHNDDNWTNLYQIEDVPTQSNSDNTVLSYHLVDAETSSYILGDKMWELPDGSRLDFQVEAMIGYIHRVQQGNFAPYYFTGETSSWSSTQSLIILSMIPFPSPSLSSTPSPSPIKQPTSTQTAEPFPIPIFSTPTPTAEPFPTTLVMTVVIVVVIATIVLMVLIIVGLMRYIVKSKKSKS